VTTLTAPEMTIKSHLMSSAMSSFIRLLGLSITDWIYFQTKTLVMA